MLDNGTRFAIDKGCATEAQPRTGRRTIVTTDATSEGKPGEPGHGHGHDREVTVTVVAPNNHPDTFTVDLHERVDKVAREAVRTFVAARIMEQMECGLALVVDGVARPLDDGARLEDVGVQANSRLALVPKAPKTDG